MCERECEAAMLQGAVRPSDEAALRPSAESAARAESAEGTPYNSLRTFTQEPRPQPDRDSLTRIRLARQRST